MSFLKVRKPTRVALRAFGIWTAATVGVLGLVLAGAMAGESAYARFHENRMFPGVRVLDIRVDGMTRTEARDAVQRAVDAELAKGLRFTFGGQEVQLQVSAAPDLPQDLVRYSVDDAIAEGFSVGRRGGWLWRFAEQLHARVRPLQVPVGIAIDDKRIEDVLRSAFKERIVPAKDARFSFRIVPGSAPFISIETEEYGRSFETVAAFAALRRQAERLSFAPIALNETSEAPRVRRDDLEPVLPEVEEFLNRPSLTFAYEKESYPIATSTLAGWLTVEERDGRPRVTIGQEQFGASLRAMAPHLEKSVKNGSLVVRDGKIESFVAGTQGQQIKVADMHANLLAEWPAKQTFPVLVETTSGLLLGDDPERLGIREIIGIGTSNFSGSPTNRRKNIRLGIQKVNGTLIAPGGEFSLLKTLGSVDGENGWLPELVIKGNETKPEFGGGLCQIGTTTFRAALNSGLDITARQNHSYRVRYYEPAGTDATIYEPAPDFRFANDTANHLLINAYQNGDNVTFEFWGTKDGRKIAPLKSRVYNITPPPPPKLIETLELPPGKKKCTESPHAGADAELPYRVTYADGTVHEEVFKSHYRPWGEVCLIGVEKLSGASSTGDAIPLAE